MPAKRPPVEETASFLQSLIASHGPNYLEKLFGSKARDALAPLGGIEKVAIALSESQTIEDFGAALHLMRWVIHSVQNHLILITQFQVGLGAFEISVSGCGKRWSGHVEVVRYKGFGIGRREIFPRKIG